jgi:hypothetical protein
VLDVEIAIASAPATAILLAVAPDIACADRRSAKPGSWFSVEVARTEIAPGLAPFVEMTCV